MVELVLRNVQVIKDVAREEQQTEKKQGRDDLL